MFPTRPESADGSNMNWKNTTVIVTGACGFIGSRLAEALLQRGARVRALALYDARGGYGWLDDLPADTRRQIECLSGDVRDVEFVRRMIEPDSVVFHLAALIGIPYSYHAPRSYFETNLTGTLNILEAARDRNASRVLVASTSEVYGTAQSVPINEDHPLQGQSPYSASKIAAEKAAESYWYSFDLPVTIVRPFNTYGPRQSPRAVIPTILMQLLNDCPTLKLGDWDTTRDFNFVNDTSEGFIRLAECPAAIGECVNVGSGTETSIRAIAETAQTLLKHQARLESDTARIRPARSEVRRLCAGNRRLRELTGWAPATTLADGLQATAEWIKQHPALYDPKRYYI